MVYCIVNVKNLLIKVLNFKNTPFLEFTQSSVQFRKTSHSDKMDSHLKKYTRQKK
jgi:hypothetical protein